MKILHIFVLLVVCVMSALALDPFSPTLTKSSSSDIYSGSSGMEMTFNSYYNGNSADVDIATATYLVGNISAVDYTNCKVVRSGDTLGLSNIDWNGAGMLAGHYQSYNSTTHRLTMALTDPSGRGINGLYIAANTSQALVLVCPTYSSNSDVAVQVTWVGYSAREHTSTNTPTDFAENGNFTVVNNVCQGHSIATFSNSSVTITFPNNNNGTSAFAYTEANLDPNKYLPMQIAPVIYLYPTNLGISQVDNNGSYDYSYYFAAGVGYPPWAGYTYYGVTLSRVIGVLGVAPTEPCETAIFNQITVQ